VEIDSFLFFLFIRFPGGIQPAAAVAVILLVHVRNSSRDLYAAQTAAQSYVHIIYIQTTIGSVSVRSWIAWPR